MILYHTTTRAGADAILEQGFRGGSGSYMFAGLRLEGVVFLGVRPADVNDGAKGDTVLSVDVGDRDLAEYLIDEEGLPPWEYVVPAEVLNALPAGAVTVLDLDEM